MSQTFVVLIESENAAVHGGCSMKNTACLSIRCSRMVTEIFLFTLTTE